MDKFSKVADGDALRFSAALQNAMIDTVRAHQNTKSGRDGGKGVTDSQSHADIVSVKWTGSSITTLDAFSVLQVSGIVLSPVDNQFAASHRPAFEASAPANANRPFAITTEPITGQRVGRAAVSGVAVVKVSVSNTSHMRARPIVGDTSKLESCESGGIPILWKPTGTGEKWAQVILDFSNSDKAGADCSSFLGSIGPRMCATLSMPEAPVGSCACVPSQSASLSWDAAAVAMTSPTFLYGCPPGVITTLCPLPTGAPRKFNLSVAGFTGGSVNFNGNYTLTYSTGETWTVVRAGVTATAINTGSGWTLTLDDGTFTVSYTTGMAVPLSCCTSIAFELDADGGTTDAPDDLTITPATSCGRGPAYTPKLYRCLNKCGQRTAVLEFVPVAGSGARSIIFDPPMCGVDANGNKYMDFATDDPLLCSGTAAGDCGENKLVVRVTCTCCEPITVEGWYCVAGECQYLSGESLQECGLDVWAGPFDTEAECSCSVTTLCCDPTTYPRRLCVSLGVSAVPELGNQTFEVQFADTGESIPQINPVHPEYDCDAYLVPADQPTWWYCRDYDIDRGNQWLKVYVTPCDGGKFKVLVLGVNASGDPITLTVILNASCTLPLTGAGTTGPSSFGSIDVTLAEVPEDGCSPAPPEVTYNCIPGTGCVEVYDGSGRYLSESGCLVDCDSGDGGSESDDDCFDCGLLGLVPTIVIPDGPHAGTYFGSAWATSLGGPESPLAYSDFYVAGSADGDRVYCGGVSGNAGIVANSEHGSTGGATTCGTPTVMVFPGGIFGSTGDVTVTT